MCERIDWDRCLEQGEPPFRAELLSLQRSVDREIRRNVFISGLGVAASPALVYALFFAPHGPSAGGGSPSVVLGGLVFGICCFVYFGAGLAEALSDSSDARTFKRSLRPLEDQIYGEMDKWCEKHKSIRLYRNAALERGGIITTGEFSAMKSIMLALSWAQKQPRCNPAD